MTKIYIVTTHRANNFGAVLQAYSLVKTVRELGVEAYILDWRTRLYEYMYHTAFRLSRHPFIMVRNLFNYIRYEKQVRRKFAEFRDVLPLSPRVCCRRNLKKCIQGASAVIVGSDQVWNPRNSALNPLRFDRTYLLDFLGPMTMKFAYAASIGVDTIQPKCLENEFVQAWKTFDGITMREQAGSDYVSSLIGKSVQTVLDPVLLHDAKWWEREEKPMAIAQPFVFDYVLRKDEELSIMVREFAREHNLQIVKPLAPGLGQCPNSDTSLLGPREFIWAIHHADYVFTNSFHAMAFSLIYGKKVYYKRTSGAESPNTRFDMFREMVLARHQMGNLAETPIELFDFTDIEVMKLVSLREVSYAALSKMIGHK